MTWCPSCGGVIGRECFNPQECAWITADMAQRAERDRYAAQERERDAELEAEYEAHLAASRPAADTGGASDE